MNNTQHSNSEVPWRQAGAGGPPSQLALSHTQRSASRRSRKTVVLGVSQVLMCHLHEAPGGPGQHHCLLVGFVLGAANLGQQLVGANAR
jgi:hypothetical protein